MFRLGMNSSGDSSSNNASLALESLYFRPASTKAAEVAAVALPTLALGAWAKAEIFRRLATSRTGAAGKVINGWTHTQKASTQI